MEVKKVLQPVLEKQFILYKSKIFLNKQIFRLITKNKSLIIMLKSLI